MFYVIIFDFFGTRNNWFLFCGKYKTDIAKTSASAYVDTVRYKLCIMYYYTGTAKKKWVMHTLP